MEDDEHRRPLKGIFGEIFLLSMFLYTPLYTPYNNALTQNGVIFVHRS